MSAPIRDKIEIRVVLDRTLAAEFPELEPALRGRLAEWIVRTILDTVLARIMTEMEQLQ